MKKTLIFLICSMINLVIQAVFAQTNTLVGTPNIMTVQNADHKPCLAIASACEAAGYRLGANAAPGKEIRKDCLRPIIKGQVINGVNVDPADIQACKMRMKQLKNKRENMNHDVMMHIQ